MDLDYILSITSLKRDAAELIEKAREHGSPVIITQNGQATAVLQDVHSFQEERRAFALLKLALEGEREIAEGRGMSYAQHRRRMKALRTGPKSR